MEKTLVTYFSATGATKRLAQKIADTLQADIFEIEPVRKYTEEDLKWPSTDNRSCLEMKNKNFRPSVVKKVDNLEKYESVFLGFPVWYDTAPTIINTFIEENCLLAKDVYVFVTSGAHGVERSLKDLRKTYPYISFISGKRFRGLFYESEVWNWLNETSEAAV